MPALLTIFILLDTAHRLSPLLLSWAHPGFRQLMFSKPRKYILWPLAAFLVGAAIPLATGLHFYQLTPTTNPFPVMFAVYTMWNFWHFVMQNYGVMRLCGCSPNARRKIDALVITAVGFMVSYPVVFVFHWLTDIGLSAYVMGRRWWMFLAILACAAPIAFAYQMPPWLVPNVWQITYRPTTSLWMVALIGLAMSTSFAHFATSRLLWKFSDLGVRETIGRALLPAAA